MLNPMRSNRHQSGFTMLEVLISMVIIAFGLLGVAGLQAFALKNNQSAAQRNAAVLLAQDLADRVRANPAGALDGFYHQPDIGNYGGPVSACDASASCTTAQMAAKDLFEWQQRVRSTLPLGAGIVCIDSTPHDGVNQGGPACDGTGGTNFVVKIWWSDDRTRSAAVAAATPQRFSTTFNP